MLQLSCWIHRTLINTVHLTERDDVSESLEGYVNAHLVHYACFLTERSLKGTLSRNVQGWMRHVLFRVFFGHSSCSCSANPQNNSS